MEETKYKVETLTPVEAGYVMGMLFSIADGKYTVAKGKKIVDWLVKVEKEPFDIDGLNAFMCQHRQAEYNSLYRNCAIRVLLNEQPNFHMELIHMLFAMRSGLSKAEDVTFALTCEILNQSDLKQLAA